MYCLIIFIFLLIGCAKTEQEKVTSAVQEAKFHLSSNNCSKALGVLDDVDFQDDDASCRVKQEIRCSFTSSPCG